MKNCSISLIISEKQIKTTLRYRLLPVIPMNFSSILEQFTYLFAIYHPPEENLTRINLLGHSICAQTFTEASFVSSSVWDGRESPMQTSPLSCRLRNSTSSCASRCPTGTSTQILLKSNPSSSSFSLMFLASQTVADFLSLRLFTLRMFTLCALIYILMLEILRLLGS